MPNNVLTQLKALRDGVAEELRKDPRYQTLQSLDKSIAEITTVLSSAGLLPPSGQASSLTARLNGLGPSVDALAEPSAAPAPKQAAISAQPAGAAPAAQAYTPVREPPEPATETAPTAPRNPEAPTPGFKDGTVSKPQATVPKKGISSLLKPAAGIAAALIAGGVAAEAMHVHEQAQAAGKAKAAGHRAAEDEAADDVEEDEAEGHDTEEPDSDKTHDAPEVTKANDDKGEDEAETEEHEERAPHTETTADGKVAEDDEDSEAEHATDGVADAQDGKSEDEAETGKHDAEHATHSGTADGEVKAGVPDGEQSEHEHPVHAKHGRAPGKTEHEGEAEHEHGTPAEADIGGGEAQGEAGAADGNTVRAKKAGYVPMAAKAGATQYAPSIAVKFGKLPNKVDLRPLMTPVEDQGQTSSCVANAVAGAYEYWIKKASKQDQAISRLFVYYNARWRDGSQDKDEGSVIQLAMEGLQKFGACAESAWPFDPRIILKKPGADAYKEGAPYRVHDMAQVPLKLDAWKQALAEGKPIIFGIELFDSFDECTKRGGVVPMPAPDDIARKKHSGHSMCAVGYSESEKVFIVRNSWGTDFGDKGYCYMPYDYLLNPKFNDSDCWVFVPKVPSQPPRETWQDDTTPVTNSGQGVDFEIQPYKVQDYEHIVIDLFEHVRRPWNATIIPEYGAYVSAVSKSAFTELEHFDVRSFLATTAILAGVSTSAVLLSESFSSEMSASESSTAESLSISESLSESEEDQEEDAEDSEDDAAADEDAEDADADGADAETAEDDAEEDADDADADDADAETAEDDAEEDADDADADGDDDAEAEDEADEDADGEDAEAEDDSESEEDADDAGEEDDAGGDDDSGGDDD